MLSGVDPGERAWLVLAFLVGAALPISSALTSLGALAPLLWCVMQPRSAAAAWSGLYRHFRPLVGALAAFAVVILLGAGWALWRDLSPWEALGRHAKFLYFFVLLAFLAAPGRRLAFALGLAAAVVATLAASLYAAASGHLFMHALPGDYAIFRDHIVHNLILVLAAWGLAVLLMRDGADWRREWPGWVILALLVIDVLFLVNGRTGQVILLLLAVALVVRHGRRSAWFALAVATTTAIIAYAFLAEGSALRHGVWETWQDLAGYAGNQAQTTPTGMRLEFYRSSLAIIGEHWFLGHGTGSFADAYSAYAEQQGLSLTHTENPHSDALYFWLENGLPGLLALVAVYVAIVRAGLRAAQPYRELLLGLAAVYMLAGSINSTLMDHATGHLFFALLATLVAGAMPGKARHS